MMFYFNQPFINGGLDTCTSHNSYVTIPDRYLLCYFIPLSVYIYERIYNTDTDTILNRRDKRLHIPGFRGRVGSPNSRVYSHNNCGHLQRGASCAVLTVWPFDRFWPFLAFIFLFGFSSSGNVNFCGGRRWCQDFRVSQSGNKISSIKR